MKTCALKTLLAWCNSNQPENVFEHLHVSEHHEFSRAAPISWRQGGDESLKKLEGVIRTSISCAVCPFPDVLESGASPHIVIRSARDFQDKNTHVICESIVSGAFLSSSSQALPKDLNFIMRRNTIGYKCNCDSPRCWTIEGRFIVPKYSTIQMVSYADKGLHQGGYPATMENEGLYYLAA